MATSLSAHAMPDRVTVAWDPNPEPDIAGYRVYYGVAGSGLTNIVNPVTSTQQSILSLVPQTPYWFYVTAVNTAGLESDPSEILTYTTPADLAPTLSIGPDRMAIVPATISLTATATDDWMAADQLVYSWQQTAGTSVGITGAATRTASIPITNAGNYSFSVGVSDGVNLVNGQVSVTAVQRVENPPPGAVVPDINTMLPSFDGLILGWNSAPGANYVIAFKESLDETTWSILANGVASMGAVTYWVDEHGGLGKQGFYGIFQIP